MTPRADDRAALTREWLRSLHGRALTWVRESPLPHGRTENYVDLAFAFGAARVGDRATAEAALAEHGPILLALDQAHRALFLAYDYRIRQALDGKPHAGPLPNEQMEYLEHMERLGRYVVDRLRRHSRIIEPETVINPYRHWGARINDFEKALAELADLTDPLLFEQRVRTLAASASGPPSAAWRVWEAVLKRPAIASPGLLRQAIEETRDRWNSPGGLTDDGFPPVGLFLLENALVAASSACLGDLALPLVHAAGQWFPALPPLQAGRLVAPAVQLLVECGLRQEEDDFLQAASAVVKGWPAGFAQLTGNLAIADGWYVLRRDRQADPLVEAAFGTLSTLAPSPSVPALTPRERVLILCALARSVQHATQPTADRHLTNVLRQPGVRDTYTTSCHFCTSTLDVVEAIVLSAINVCRITDT